MNNIDHITNVIMDTIESEPHERRLYPDLYAEKVARAVCDELGITATPARELNPTPATETDFR